MRKPTLVAYIVLTALFAISSLTAQTRSVPAGSDAGRAVSSATSTASTSTSTVATASTSVSTSPSADYSAWGNRAFGTNPAILSRNIQGSSFSTIGLYNSWADYYSYLYSYYHIFPDYFGRFYRNYEPLMTPAMMKVTLRQPLSLSAAMLQSIDELENMLSDARAGKPVDKKAILAKTQEIENFAKRIRQDRTLSIVDIRKETVIFKDDNLDALDPAAIAKLREMALDLNRQLSNMYSESSTSTVSVDSYKEPSFESVTKGIEKACKAIEHSSKRI